MPGPGGCSAHQGGQPLEGVEKVLTSVGSRAELVILKMRPVPTVALTAARTPPQGRLSA